MLTSLNLLLIVLAIISLISFGFLLVSGFKRSVLWGLAVLLVPFAALVYAFKYWYEVKKPFLIYAGASITSVGIGVMMFMQMGGMQAIELAQKIQDGTLTEQDAAQFMMASLDGMKELGLGGQAEAMDQIQTDPNLTAEQRKQVETLLTQIEDVASGEQAPFNESADDMLAQLRRSAEQSLQSAPIAEPARTPFPSLKYVESPIKAPSRQQAARKTSGFISIAEADTYLGKVMVVTTNDGRSRKVVLIDVKKATLEFQRNAFGGSLSFKLRPDEIKSLLLK